jgi:predicted RNA-binding Zn-ribbon protein involved in translation (DUF1610 family)
MKLFVSSTTFYFLFSSLLAKEALATTILEDGKLCGRQLPQKTGVDLEGPACGEGKVALCRFNDHKEISYCASENSLEHVLAHLSEGSTAGLCTDTDPDPDPVPWIIFNLVRSMKP